MKRTIALLTASLVLVALSAMPAGAKTPRSCKRALAAAEEIVDINSRFASTVSEFFGDVKDAADIGAMDGDVESFIDALTSATNDLTEATSDLTDEMTPAVATYKSNASRCRAG